MHRQLDVHRGCVTFIILSFIEHRLLAFYKGCPINFEPDYTVQHSAIQCTYKVRIRIVCFKRSRKNVE